MIRIVDDILKICSRCLDEKNDFCKAQNEKKYCNQMMTNNEEKEQCDTPLTPPLLSSDTVLSAISVLFVLLFSRDVPLFSSGTLLTAIGALFALLFSRSLLAFSQSLLLFSQSLLLFSQSLLVFSQSLFLFSCSLLLFSLIK